MKNNQADSLVINFTPTGLIPTKQMTPHVPITPEEIVNDVLEAYDLGITMVHLHARDSKNGRPAYKAEIYGQIIEGIRQHAPELVVCVSLSGRIFKKFEHRADPLFLTGNLKPDMGSLTLSSLNFNRHASVNEPDMIVALAEKMKELSIKPELEVFDTGMVNYANYMIRKGLLAEPYYFNLILGNIACAQADLLHTGILIRDLPEKSVWSIGGVGQSQLSANAMAVAIGGGVRVGLEDNIWYDKDRTKLARNIDLVKRIHNIAGANERGIMSPKALRECLKLENGKGQYGSRR